MPSKTRPAYWENRNDYLLLDMPEMVEELTDRGVNVDNLTTNFELRNRLECLDRGRLYYTDIKKDELHRFVRARGLNKGLKPSCRTLQTHHGLAGLLTNGDKKAKFELLMKLAPELRLCIYESYIDTLPEQPDTLTPPPLAMVSKQVRGEFLNIFYQHSAFQLRFTQKWRDGRPAKRMLCPSLNATRFLTRLSPDIAARLRTIVLDLTLTTKDPYRSWTKVDTSLMELTIATGTTAVGTGYSITCDVYDDANEQWKLEERIGEPLCQVLEICGC